MKACGAEFFGTFWLVLGGCSLLADLVYEVVMTMMFLLIILGATDKRAPRARPP